MKCLFLLVIPFFLFSCNSEDLTDHEQAIANGKCWCNTNELIVRVYDQGATLDTLSRFHSEYREFDCEDIYNDTLWQSDGRDYYYTWMKCE